MLSSRLGSFFDPTLDVFDPFQTTSPVEDMMSMLRDRPRNILRSGDFRDVGKQSALLKADVVEEDACYHIIIDVPGVKRESIDVSISEGYLHIKVDRPEMLPCEGEFPAGYLKRLERPVGRRQRSILLPQGADPERVETNLCDGVLCIKFGKLPTHQTARKLQIS